MGQRQDKTSFAAELRQNYARSKYVDKMTMPELSQTDATALADATRLEGSV
jgi:hypothetical protein